MSPETLSILLPAFAAGMLVLATHVPLGMEVLRRGIIFIDLAIAQIAALGALSVEMLLHDAGLYLKQGVALLFALLAAYGFRWLERHSPARQEAFIGASFIAASSLAMLLVAGSPHAGEQIEAVLAGQILWAEWPQILWMAVLSAVVLLAWHSAHGRRHFYSLFAVTVTLSVQLVGVYLVFACLIFPALAAEGRKHPLRTGYGAALTALALGLLLSAATDLPTGPVLVCSLAALCLMLRLCRRNPEAG